jgi:hypothetical protein
VAFAFGGLSDCRPRCRRVSSRSFRRAGTGAYRLGGDWLRPAWPMWRSARAGWTQPFAEAIGLTDLLRDAVRGRGRVLCSRRQRTQISALEGGAVNGGHRALLGR